MLAPATGQTADSTLVERSWQSPDAFAALFDRHADSVHRYAARRLGTQLADDVTAETFAVAFQRRRGYDLAHTDARPWLLGIATNLMRTHRRAEARRWKALARAAAAVQAEPEADAVAARVSAQAVRRELMSTLARLPARQRDVLLLYAWAELDYEQIALALAVPVGTVRSRLHRARAALQAELPGFRGETRWTT
jgi:RNA polymerase sigma factor (sigma-70 family)